MSVRLYCVCGLSELLVCAHLKSKLFSDRPGRDVVLLYGMPISMPARLRRQTKELAQLFTDWDAVIDFTEETAVLAGRGWREYEDIFEALNEALDGGEVTDLILHSVYKQPEQILLDHFSRASLVVYDNGLVSYVDPEKLFPKTAFPVRVRPADQERIASYCFSLSDVLGLPAYLSDIRQTGFSENEYKHLLDRAGRRGVYAHLSALLRGAPDKASLVLGTPFHRNPRVSLEGETEVYRNAVQKIRPTQEHAVFYKDHPRSSHDLTLGSSYFYRLETVAPVEFLAMQHDIQACYSISSTSLLLMKKFFGVESYVIGPQIGRTMNVPYIDLLYRHVPILEDWPEGV